jgi:hypothetical protein
MVFPYPKGLIIIKCGFYILFYVSCVVNVFAGLWYLTSGIKALSSATKKGNFFSVLHFFQREREREKGSQHSG